jgi:ATP-dependent helicase/nuclease subunit B
VLRVAGEVEGLYRIGDFTLKGRADRIEEKKDGSLSIADYKTGTLPAKAEVEEGLASQLVLLALIASDGESTLHGDVSSLEYWQLQGGREPGTIQPVKEALIPALIESAKKGLKELIETYRDPGFPYRSTPIPSRAGRYNDYEHLARIKEWG